MTKLHARTYSVSKEDDDVDRELAVRLAALQFVQPEHLDIPIRYHNEDTWTVSRFLPTQPSEMRIDHRAPNVASCSMDSTYVHCALQASSLTENFCPWTTLVS